MPLTRFCVYWTISENKNANAEAETSDTRVLLRFLSYIFGRGGGSLLEAVTEDADGSENLVEPVEER
jgi:hypothetical protein